MGGYAQQVKGTITDIETGEVLPFTNVVLKNIADSSFISGVVTYISGVYELKYKPEQVTGKAILEFTCMGYRKVVKGPFKKSDIPTILDIKLAKIVNEVGPVLITAQKPKMQVQAGKTTVDIAGSSMSQGLSAADVLQRMPGVTLDNDGNITIKGKQGAMVMINDKPTYLSQAQVLALLRSTPSNNISEIEIITQPGAQFDASGTAGMINIKMKKAVRENLQGEIRAEAGHGRRYKGGIGAQISEKRKRFGYLASVDFRPVGNINAIPSARKYFIGNSFQEQQVNVFYDVEEYGYIGRGALTYDFSDYSSIQSQISYNYSSEFWRSNNTNKIYSDNTLISEVLTTDRNPDDKHNLTYAIGYQNRFDSSGKHLLKIDFDLAWYKQDSKQSLRNSFKPINGIQPEETGVEMYFSPRTLVLAPKIDYEHKLNNKNTILFGAKHVEVRNRNVTDQFTYTPTFFGLDSNGSNSYKYVERITALYGIYRYKYSEKLNFELGLRAEQWYTEGNQTLLNPAFAPLSFNRDKLQLFPNLSSSWKISDSKSLSVQYSRRVERPDYNSLIPYAFNVDPYSVWAGNPNLLPELSNNIELTYSLLEGALSLSANHFWAANKIAESTLIRLNDTSRFSRIAPINIASFRNTGLSINYYKELKKWYNFNLFTHFYTNHFQTSIRDNTFNNKRFSYTIQLTNNFNFGKGWKGDVFAMYQYFNSESLGYQKPWGMLNLSVRKNFAKDRGTLRLSANDVLVTQKFYWSETVVGMLNQGSYRGDFTNVMLSFTWRFGGEQKINLRDTDENLQRVGGK